MPAPARTGVVEWNGKKVYGAVKTSVRKGMGKATTHARRETVAVLRKSPSPSPEGGPPGRGTGDLAKAVKKKTKTYSDGVTGLVGILDDPEQAAVGARLAGGFVGTDRLGRTFSQAPRPWITTVVRAEAAEITRLIASGGL